MLTRLSITTWDAILVGDGSGSMWGWPIGWGCVLIAKDSATRKLFFGGCNDGTVNVAELLAYLAPLSWYLAEQCAKSPHGRLTGMKQVHIITDSQYAQSKGETKAAVTMTRNTVLWGAFALYERQGLHLTWHWRPREDVQLNKLADALSKGARGLIKNGGLPETIQQAMGLTAASCNPD